MLFASFVVMIKVFYKIKIKVKIKTLISNGEELYHPYFWIHVISYDYLCAFSTIGIYWGIKFER